MEDKFQIDITPQLESFAHQLEQEDRVIFSAGFGDGKTYFLNHFQEEFKDKYIFFTVYPVNYVISENDHILDYIKRDILVQLANDNGLYLDEIKLKEVLDCIADNVSLEGLASFAAGIPVLTRLSKVVLRKKWKLLPALRNSHYSTDKFVDSLNYRGSVYDNDAYTVFIAKSLDALRNLENKKMVLVIEDLDRLEPGKIFNILNVFGSHLDRPFFNKSGESISNKFGFDKIITVMDHSRVEKCFEYLYGTEQNFQGFLSKFMVSKPFHYSISDLARDVVAKKLYPLYGLSPTNDTVYKGLLKLLGGRSIRDLERIYNYDPQIDIKDVSFRSLGSYVISAKSPMLLRELYTLKFHLDLLPPSLIKPGRNKDDDYTYLQLYAPYLFFTESLKDIRFNGECYNVSLYGDDNEFFTILVDKAYYAISPFYEINNLSTIVDSIRTSLRQMCYS